MSVRQDLQRSIIRSCICSCGNFGAFYVIPACRKKDGGGSCSGNNRQFASPDTLNTEVYDEIIPVDNEDSFEYGKVIAKEEGVLVGISSGAALYAALEVAKRPEFEGKTVVVLLPDSGDRYYSTDLFKD